MTESESVYTPSPWQQAFHACDANEVLGGGAAGGGKTVALLMDPTGQIISEHQRCEAFDRWQRNAGPKPKHGLRWGESRGWALHLRRELTELQQTIALSQTMFRAIDRGAKYDRESHTWVFSSGYRYQFGHCKELNDYVRYLGAAYTWIGFDELITFSKEQYDAITARLRTGDPVLRGMLKIRACSNPGPSPGSDPDWVRKLFVDPAPQGERLLTRTLRMTDGTPFTRTRVFLPCKLTDNPNKQFAIDYEQELQGKPAHIRKAYLEGNWYFTPGSFFGEDFDKVLHVRRPFKVPHDWPVFRSMDWGHKSPGCIGWYTLDDDENLIMFEELYFQGLLDTRVAERVRDIERRLGYWDDKRKRSRILGCADTQIWEERGHSHETIYDVFAKMGVPWDQADKSPGSRQAHATRVLQRLKSHNCGTDLPGLMFTANCIKTIATVQQIRTDPNKPEEPLKGGDDHAYDQLAYASGYATRGRMGIVVQRDSKDDWDEFDRPEKGASNSRWGYGATYR